MWSCLQRTLASSSHVLRGCCWLNEILIKAIRYFAWHVLTFWHIIVSQHLLGRLRSAWTCFWYIPRVLNCNAKTKVVWTANAWALMNTDYGKQPNLIHRHNVELAFVDLLQALLSKSEFLVKLITQDETWELLYSLHVLQKFVFASHVGWAWTAQWPKLQCDWHKVIKYENAFSCCVVLTACFGWIAYYR